MNLQLAAKALRLLADALEAPGAEPVTTPDTRLTLREAVAEVGGGPKSLRKAIRLGTLPAERAGRALLIKRSDLTAFAQTRRIVPKPAAPAPAMPASGVPGDVGAEAVEKLLAGGRLHVFPGGKGKAR